MSTYTAACLRCGWVGERGTRPEAEREGAATRRPTAHRCRSARRGRAEESLHEGGRIQADLACLAADPSVVPAAHVGHTRRR
jgi:hypothetical protein